MMCVGRHLFVFFSPCFSPGSATFMSVSVAYFSLPSPSLSSTLIQVSSVSKTISSPRQVEYYIFSIKEVILFLVVS